MAETAARAPLTEQKLLKAIARQMEIGSEFSDAFIGARTGLICRIMETDSTSPEYHLIQAGLFRMIPPITSQDLYLWMVEFSGGVEDKEVRKELLTALDGIAAVWRFANVLYPQPELSEQWENFKNRKLMSTAEEWFHSIRDQLALPKN